MLFHWNNKNYGVGEYLRSLWSREKCNSFFNISRSKYQQIYGLFGSSRLKLWHILPFRFWYSLNIARFPEVIAIVFQNSSWVSVHEAEAGAVDNAEETWVWILSCRPITWSSGGKRPKYRSEHQEPIQPPDDLARESVLCSVSLWEDTQIPFQQPFLDWQAWYVNMQAIAKFKNWELWLRGRKRGGIRKRTMEK